MHGLHSAKIEAIYLKTTMCHLAPSASGPVGNPSPAKTALPAATQPSSFGHLATVPAWCQISLHAVLRSRLLFDKAIAQKFCHSIASPGSVQLSPGRLTNSNSQPHETAAQLNSDTCIPVRLTTQLTTQLTLLHLWSSIRTPQNSLPLLTPQLNSSPLPYQLTATCSLVAICLSHRLEKSSLRYQSTVLHISSQ